MKNNVIAKWWSSYKYRFVPWIAMNVKHESETHPNDDDQQRKSGQTPYENGPVTVPVHHLRKSEEMLITDIELTQKLSKFFEQCQHFDGWKRETDLKEVAEHNKKVMLDQFGFTVERRESKVNPDAGKGVFISEGVARKGSIVALYCGTLYMPGDPLFFPSLGNKFIFRCKNGMHIDGNDKWISKSIYKSCAGRDKIDLTTPSCDSSWMNEKYFLNPLNLGQYVNNRSHTQRNNVIYQECLLTLEDPPGHRHPPNLNDDSFLTVAEGGGPQTTSKFRPTVTVVPAVPGREHDSRLGSAATPSPESPIGVSFDSAGVIGSFFILSKLSSLTGVCVDVEKVESSSEFESVSL